jgi:hypothetical protein
LAERKRRKEINLVLPFLCGTLKCIDVVFNGWLFVFRRPGDRNHVKPRGSLQQLESTTVTDSKIGKSPFLVGINRFGRMSRIMALSGLHLDKNNGWPTGISQIDSNNIEFANGRPMRTGNDLVATPL